MSTHHSDSTQEAVGRAEVRTETPESVLSDLHQRMLAVAETLPDRQRTDLRTAASGIVYEHQRTGEAVDRLFAVDATYGLRPAADKALTAAGKTIYSDLEMALPGTKVVLKPRHPAMRADDFILDIAIPGFHDAG